MSSLLQSQHPAEIVRTGRAAFASGRSRKLQFREGQLRALLRLVNENETRLLDAVFADLHKPPLETTLCEVDVIRNEIHRALHKIWDWSKPETPTKGFTNLLDIVHIRKDPYGLVLIVATWCYPLLLLLRPFIGALAAGNCVILKPSDKAYTTAMLLAELIGRYLDNECYQVFNGGVLEIGALLRQRFDYVFYTGGEATGKLVREVTNRYLTPTTLELGGKCPVFVDEGVNFAMAAKRIVWGKVVNAGQTCIAPDYLLCSKSVEDRLITALQQAIQSLLGADPRVSPYFARIINDAQYERLVQLMAGAKVAVGGHCDPYERYIEPTILTNISGDNALMYEEIFGPLLPIVNVTGCDEAIEFVARREKPLALYIFSNSKHTIDKFIHGTSSGSVVVNDVGVQWNADNVPFGGIGASGMGAYGGKYSFDTFTHHKTCLIRDLGSFSENLNMMKYPPYSNGKVKLLRMICRPRNYPPLAWMKNYLIFFLGVAVAAAFYYYSK